MRYVNCSPLCAQLRQRFIPSAMRYVPLGDKSSYKSAYTNQSAPFPVRLCKIIAKTWQNCTNNNFNSFFGCIKIILRRYLFQKSPNKLKNQDSLNPRRYLDQRGNPRVFPSMLPFPSCYRNFLCMLSSFYMYHNNFDTLLSPTEISLHSS